MMPMSAKRRAKLLSEVYVARPDRLVHKHGKLHFDARCPVCNGQITGDEEHCEKRCQSCRTVVFVEIGDKDVSKDLWSESYLRIDWAH